MTAEKLNGKAWVRLKLTFTDAVMDERGLPPLVFKVAAALARFAEADTGIVDRSQAFLADKVETTTRSLQSAIDVLVTRGYVTKIKPGGPRLGVKYRLTLRSKPVEEDVFTKPASPKDPPSLTKLASQKSVSLAKSSVGFSEASFASSPVKSPVIDPPVGDATPNRPAEAGTTTTIGDAGDGLLDEVRTAIEAAGGKLANRRHNLQPLRDLIAGGISRDLAVAVIADRAAVLIRRSGPLGNLDALWLLDCIRNRAVAEGYGPGAATTSPASMTADAGPTVRLPGSEARWPADDVQRWAARWWNDRRSWPEQALGEAPDRQDARRSPDFQAALDAGRAEIVAAVASWQHDPASWNAQRLGPPPDSLSSRLALAPEFVDGVRLRSGLVVTVAALHRALDAGQLDEDVFGGPPSRANNPASALSPEWQIEALEYRAGRV